MATHRTDGYSSLVHTTVAEAMRPGVVTCGPEQRLARVAATMAAHSIHTVVVPSVLGGAALTITDLDLIRHGSEAASERPPSTSRVIPWPLSPPPRAWSARRR